MISHNIPIIYSLSDLNIGGPENYLEIQMYIYHKTITLIIYLYNVNNV